jgi:hypothetical protein
MSGATVTNEDIVKDWVRGLPAFYLDCNDLSEDN